MGKLWDADAASPNANKAETHESRSQFERKLQQLSSIWKIHGKTQLADKQAIKSVFTWPGQILTEWCSLPPPIIPHGFHMAGLIYPWSTKIPGLGNLLSLVKWSAHMQIIRTPRQQPFHRKPPFCFVGFPPSKVQSSPL